MYDTLLSRSFSKQEKRKLGYGGLITCFLIALSFCTIFKPYLGPLPVLNFRLSIGAGRTLDIVNDTSSSLLLSGNEEIITKNTVMKTDTSSSHQQSVKQIFGRKNNETINDSSGSQQIVREIVKDTIIINNTNNSVTVADDVQVKRKNPLIFTEKSTSQPIVRDAETATKNNKIEPAVVLCNTTERSDFCEIKGDIRIDANSSTIFVVSSENDMLAATANTSSWSIRPYARKNDKTAMSHTKEWSVKQLVTDHHKIPNCTENHGNVPAILFSLGGYSGNHFHAFTDIIIPLYSTARPYNGVVQFLVTDKQPWWIAKFKVLLKALSRYDVIEIDNRQNVHCFTGITVGLKRYSRKELSIDSSKFGQYYSMKDFRQFLRSSYSLNKLNAIKLKNKVPRLLIISRKRTRAFSNVDEIVKLAKRLGYKVIVYEPNADVLRTAQVMNSCDVVLGVHGAGLTNIVFLPENAILIQVLPFGGAEWVSKTFFEEPAKEMNIRYLEYKISVEESSLIQQYPADHVVLRNPSLIQKQGWETFKSIYFDKQNVKLDLDRFRHTLLKALELLHQ